MAKTLACIAIVGALSAMARGAQTVEGDWEGHLKAGPQELRVVLHIAPGEKGGWRATMDSPDQGAKGIPIDSISISGSTVKFESQAIHGAFSGEVDPKYTTISGTWTQGPGSLPLTFTRAKPEVERKKAAKPSDIDGDWAGTLDAGGKKLRLVLHITSYEDGLGATLDSLDQNARGLPVTSISRDSGNISFDMKAIGGSFRGSLDGSRRTLSGDWSQSGSTLPLVFHRER